MKRINEDHVAQILAIVIVLILAFWLGPKYVRFLEGLAW
jgi:hypothetical protein